MLRFLLICGCLFQSIWGDMVVNNAVLVGASGQATNGKKVKLLSNGDIIIGGTTTTSSIGGQTSNGNSDFLIQRYDSSGILIWTRLFGGSSADTLTSLAVDKNDAIYAVGTCSGTVDGHSNSGNADICIVSYDKDGTKLTSNVLGGSGTDTPGGVCVDSSATYVYIVGDSGFSLLGITSVGSNPSFWLKLDTATLTKQNVAWLNQYGSSNDVYDCSIDSSGNIISVGGVGSGNSFFGLSSPGGADATAFKTTPSGTYVWAARLGGSNTDYANALVIDSSDNIYMIGSTVPGTTFYDTAFVGQRDIFLIKLDSSGNKVWSNLLGSTGADDGFGIALDQTNNYVYATGSVHNTFYGSSGTSAGLGSTFLATLSMTDGTIVSTTTLRSTSNDVGNDIIMASGSSTLYIVGSSNGNYGTSTVHGAPDLSLLFVGPSGSAAPTKVPTLAPVSLSPTLSPTRVPTFSPTRAPTRSPTLPPVGPTLEPTAAPSLLLPSSVPTSRPSEPTFQPTLRPSTSPTTLPTSRPSTRPTNHPTALPSSQPSSRPSSQPTVEPSSKPSTQPTSRPTIQPTGQPTSNPTRTRFKLNDRQKSKRPSRVRTS